VDINNDSYNLTLSVVLICLFFHTNFSLPNTLLALLCLAVVVATTVTCHIAAVVSTAAFVGGLA